MNIRKGILLLLITLGTTLSFGRQEINYQHKALLRILQKAGIEDMDGVREIVLSDSLMQAMHIQGKYFQVSSIEQNNCQYLYVGRVNSCRAGGCSITNTYTEGESEYFDYCILYDHRKCVQTVKVFNYQATHGHEISAKGWLKQFIGHDGSEELRVDKNVDAISGATISVYAITFDIEMKTKVLLDHVK